MTLTVSEFATRWQGRAGDGRANKDSFFLDFCEALGLDPPGPKDASPDYCFEKDREVFFDGSARIALGLTPGFDRYVLNEKDQQRVGKSVHV